MPGFGFTSKRDREYKELMKQRMEQLDRDMNKHVVPLSAMDARKLTSLGDAYSAEAYELAHKL